LDGNIECADTKASQIGRITPTGAITEFPLPRPGQPYGITVGPDGNLWFTELQSDASSIWHLGVINTYGSITEVTIPREAVQIASLGGALWFTEPAQNAFARYVPGGGLANHILPHPNSEPMGIAPGPGSDTDEDVWLTE